MKNYQVFLERLVLVLLTIFIADNYVMSQDNKIKPSPVTHTQVDNSPISIQLIPPPPGKLGIADMWKATVINTSEQTYRLYFYGTLSEKNAGLIAEATTMEVDIKKGTNIIKANSFPIEPSVNYVHSDPKYKNSLIQTGNVPPGEYTYCVYLIKKSENAEYASQCIDVTIEDLNFLSLLTPGDEEELGGKVPIIFSWMSSKPVKDVVYKMRVVEIVSGQTPEYAYQKNLAWFEKDGIKTTVFNYPNSAKPFESGKKYAWAVTSGQTVSDINTFTISGSALSQTTLEYEPVPGEPCCFRVKINTDETISKLHFISQNSNFLNVIAEPSTTISSILLPNTFYLEPASGNVFTSGTYLAKIYLNATSGTYMITAYKQYLNHSTWPFLSNRNVSCLANSYPTVSIVPNGDCCFDIYLNNNSNLLYNSFTVNASPNQIISATAVNGSVYANAIPPGNTSFPNNKAIFVRSGAFYNIPNEKVGTICFAHTNSPITFTVYHWSTDGGGHWYNNEIEFTDTKNCPECGCGHWDSVRAAIGSNAPELIYCDVNQIITDINTNPLPVLITKESFYSCSGTNCDVVYKNYLLQSGNWGAALDLGQGSICSYSFLNIGIYQFATIVYCNGIACDTCWTKVTITDCNCSGIWNTESDVQYNDVNMQAQNVTRKCYEAGNPFGPVLCSSDDYQSIIKLSFSNYYCTYPCSTYYKWKLTSDSPNGTILKDSSILTNPLAVFSAPAGNNAGTVFWLTMYAMCGGRVCDSCAVVFTTGCPNCDCSTQGKWVDKKIKFVKNPGELPTVDNINCGQTKEVLEGTLFNLYPAGSLNCIPAGCTPSGFTFKLWVNNVLTTNPVLYPNGMDLSGLSSLNTMPNAGLEIRFYAWCGTTKCDSCQIFLRPQTCECGTQNNSNQGWVQSPIRIRIGTDPIIGPVACNYTHKYTSINELRNTKFFTVAGVYKCISNFCAPIMKYQVLKKRGTFGSLWDVIKSETNSNVVFTASDNLNGGGLFGMFKIIFTPECNSGPGGVCPPCTINVVRKLNITPMPPAVREDVVQIALKKGIKVNDDNFAEIDDEKVIMISSIEGMEKINQEDLKKGGTVLFGYAYFSEKNNGYYSIKFTLNRDEKTGIASVIDDKNKVIAEINFLYANENTGAVCKDIKIIMEDNPGGPCMIKVEWYDSEKKPIQRINFPFELR